MINNKSIIEGNLTVTKIDETDLFTIYNRGLEETVIVSKHNLYSLPDLIPSWTKINTIDPMEYFEGEIFTSINVSKFGFSIPEQEYFDDGPERLEEIINYVRDEIQNSNSSDYRQEMTDKLDMIFLIRDSNEGGSKSVSYYCHGSSYLITNDMNLVTQIKLRFTRK